MYLSLKLILINLNFRLNLCQRSLKLVSETLNLSLVALEVNQEIQDYLKIFNSSYISAFFKNANIEAGIVSLNVLSAGIEYM